MIGGGSSHPAVSCRRALISESEQKHNSSDSFSAAGRWDSLTPPPPPETSVLNFMFL